MRQIAPHIGVGHDDDRNPRADCNLDWNRIVFHSIPGHPAGGHADPSGKVRVGSSAHPTTSGFRSNFSCDIWERGYCQVPALHRANTATRGRGVAHRTVHRNGLNLVEKLCL